MKKRTMAAKDEEVPKLSGGSLPPDGEPEEVTRVGRPDEIRRALEEEGKDASHVQPRQAGNNIPTPPAPPPSAGLKKAVADEAAASARLAPPPADLLAADRERGNETPTKPPLAGVGDNVDVDAAFRENPFDDPDIPKSSEHLDSSFLEPAPPSMKALAPPLPPAAHRSGRPSASPSGAPSESGPPAGLATPSAAPGSTSSTAPLVGRESAAPSASRSMLLVLVVVVAVVGAFFVAALASGK